MNRNQTAITLARNGAVYLGRNQHKRQIGEWGKVEGSELKYYAGTLGAKQSRSEAFSRRLFVVRWFQQLVNEGQFNNAN